MKIVMVSKECPPSPRSYGIGTYVWETSKALAQHGHIVTIVAASDSDDSYDEIVNDVQIIRLSDNYANVRSIVSRTVTSSSDTELKYRNEVAKCLEKLIDTGKAEIVEFAGFRGESKIWHTYARRIPMVVRMHGFTGWVDPSWKDYISASRRLLKNWEVEELRSADHITVVANHLEAKVRKKALCDISTIYNGIDIKQWEMNSDEMEFSLKKDDILYVGSLTIRKGIITLLRAVSHLRKEGFWQGKLYLVGRKGPEFILINRLLFGRHGVPEWVELLGHRPRSELKHLYSTAGVCCFPSLKEPFNYTCMEAMASRALVIGTSKTGMEEMIANDENGFLFEPGDVRGLVNILKKALSLKRDEADSVRNAAYFTVFRRFDFSVIVPKLTKSYETILKKHKMR